MRASTSALLGERLRRQGVLDLAGADPERERAERAVGGGVGVAADDRHAGLADAELGADHVHDPLALEPIEYDRDAELRGSCARASPPACATARRGCGRRPACRRWGRCGRRSPACGRGGVPAGPRGAGRRTPAGS